MDSAKIRTLVITALFSDDKLMKRLVLKGGSALELVHRVVTRGSFDVDLSIADEFEDPDDIQARLFRAMRDRFDSIAYVVFDERFGVLPPNPPEPDPRPWWGGYALEFKIISREKWEELGRDLTRMRMFAEVVSPKGSPRFRVEISKYEFCEGSQEVEFDGFTIFVYSPELAAFEKLRAICQQMEGYETIPADKKRPRARDFYDIHALVVKRSVDFADAGNQDICRQVFHAKRVPVTLIAEIRETREFHRVDWPRVLDTLVDPPEEFDHYFGFVLAEAKKLQPLWVE